MHDNLDECMGMGEEDGTSADCTLSGPCVDSDGIPRNHGGAVVPSKVTCPPVLPRRAEARARASPCSAIDKICSTLNRSARSF